MWVEFCVALLIAVLRVNPMAVPSKVLEEAGVASTTDDEKGKFFMLMKITAFSSQLSR